MFRSFSSSDVERYRQGYPGKKDNPKARRNLEFYQGKIVSVPQGDTIDNIHKKWRGQYDRLEIHHGYIQWLFPIREDGMNMSAQELQKHEADAIAADPTLQGKIMESFSLMLDFYGFELVDYTTGAVRRADHWRSRFINLVNHPHNFLRITRILKCLGEVGLEQQKLSFLQALIDEATTGSRPLADCGRSLRDYWIETVKDDNIRARMMADFKEKMKANVAQGNGSRKKAPAMDVDDLDETPPRRKANAASPTTRHSVDEVAVGGNRAGSQPPEQPDPDLFEGGYFYLSAQFNDRKKKGVAAKIRQGRGILLQEPKDAVNHCLQLLSEQVEQRTFSVPPLLFIIPSSADRDQVAKDSMQTLLRLSKSINDTVGIVSSSDAFTEQHLAKTVMFLSEQWLDHCVRDQQNVAVGPYIANPLSQPPVQAKPHVEPEEAPAPCASTQDEGSDDDDQTVGEILHDDATKARAAEDEANRPLFAERLHDRQQEEKRVGQADVEDDGCPPAAVLH